MEVFIEQILMVLPAVRVDIFASKVKPQKSIHHSLIFSEEENTVFALTLKKEGINATAIIENGDFVVQQGSLARGSYLGKRSNKYSYWKLYDKLVEQGILVDQGKHKVFTVSYAFSSTSAAGAICNGRSTAEPDAWKVKGTGQTYKHWELASLESLET